MWIKIDLCDTVTKNDAENIGRSIYKHYDHVDDYEVIEDDYDFKEGTQ